MNDHQITRESNCIHFMAYRASQNLTEAAEAGDEAARFILKHLTLWSGTQTLDAQLNAARLAADALREPDKLLYILPERFLDPAEAEFMKKATQMDLLQGILTYRDSNHLLRAGAYRV